MSRLTDLLQNVSRLDPKLGAELTREYHSLVSSQHYGLVFEKHQPEAVELPSVTPSRGSTVRILPPRGTVDMKEADPRLWRVTKVAKNPADRNDRRYNLLERGVKEPKVREDVPGDDLVVVSEFQDAVYPGLVETDRVMAAEDPDKPAQVVLSAENYHALRLLTFTHRGKVDVIYIDPPYNTGDNDWKYNNNYVAKDDDYRHSKWLSMMERRLLLAKELLDPDSSVLIVTIDEKEYLRLGLLLEQTFPEAQMQMVTSVISGKGVYRKGQFMRVQEYIYILQFGNAPANKWMTDMLNGDFASKGIQPPIQEEPIEWLGLRRREPTAIRGVRPNQFYPVYVNKQTGFITEIGDAVDDDYDISTHPSEAGILTIWPTRGNGALGIWGLSDTQAKKNFAKGYIRCNYNKKREKATVYYLPSGTIEDIESGTVVKEGYADDGSIQGHYVLGLPEEAPRQVWKMRSHNAETYGTKLNTALLPGRRFPFPKSLYAVEDVLRFFIADKPDATILDFFSGSGTTAHAVMRLNRQDGGRRRSIMVTNNEVSPAEQDKLQDAGFRPGDPEWESLGICEYITKPRIKSAITGMTSEGEPIKGDYKFVDEFPMADGIKENAVFYTLKYLSPNMVTAGRAFEAIAPLLWMAAGQQGRVIGSLGERGWDVTDFYGVIENMDCVADFAAAVNNTAGCAVVFIVTDDDGSFQLAAQSVHEDVETRRLYESYLDNFEIIN